MRVQPILVLTLAALDAALAARSTAASASASTATATAEATAAALDPAGTWRGARWGATVDALLAAFPGEARRLDPELRLADGNTVSVAFPDQRIGGHPFQVRCVFEQGKLALVSLRTPQDRRAGPELYLALQALGRQRFGAPGEESADDNYVDLRQTRWRLADGVLDLEYVTGVVVLLYHAR